ncbi:MAG: hypothetical protein H7829_07005 [Magnetococcus sp. THC-1_WYH]
MARPWLMVLCLLVLLGAKNSYAIAPCPDSIPQVRVTVRFEKARPEYETQLSRGAIGAMMPKQQVGVHSVGLTKSVLYWNVSTRFTAISRSDIQEICIVLSHVTLEYGFGATPVFIDRRYRSGSCPFKAIFDHENGHVSILNQKGKEMHDWIKKELSARVATIGPTLSRTPTLTQKKILGQIQRQTKPLLATLKSRLESAHALLDSPQSLENTQKRCPRW